MNRAVQKLHQRRCALKNNFYVGGGLSINPDASFLSENGVPYADNQYYNECTSPMRPGALEIQPNPELAQVAMPMPQKGGFNIMTASQLAAISGKRGGTRRGLMRGGQCGLMRGGQCGLMRGGVMTAAQLAAISAKRGGKFTRRGCGCNMRGGQRGCGCSAWKLGGSMRGGKCGKPEVAWLGGKRKNATRKLKGGAFEFDVTQNVGGNGPIAEPVRTAIPCDPRAGMQNPFTATPTSPDSRTAFGYSLTPNTTTPSLQAGGGEVPTLEYSQTMMGGSYGGNAYDASCYRAPGSEMPVYPATSAGFHFMPSTEGGATLPDGITAFNEVVAHTARLGGGNRKRSYRKRSYRKKFKKARRSRRQ